MAAEAGMSHTMIGRIWRTFGLRPQKSQDQKEALLAALIALRARRQGQ
jgi:hypothetical protein